MSETRKTTDQEKEVFNFLNELRISGVTNMYGASPYIEDIFSINESEARKLLILWMENFNEECNYEEIKTKTK